MFRLLGTFFFLAIISGFTPKSNDCGCDQRQKSPKLFQCNVKTLKCKLMRKKVSYLFSIDEKGGKSTLNITGATSAGSNLLYSGKMKMVDNRKGNSGTFAVKIPVSVNKGYSWDDRTSEDFLIVTYDLSSKSITYEATGKMAVLKDINHGLTSAKIQDDFAGTPFTPLNLSRIASAYLILEYTKALKTI